MMNKRSPYVLKPTGVGRWTVGYYRANYRWVAVSNWFNELVAADVVKQLNMK